MAEIQDFVEKKENAAVERRHFFTPQEDVYLAHYWDKYPRRHWAMKQDFETVFASNRNDMSFSNRRNKLMQDGLWLKLQGLVAKYGIEDAHKHYYEVIEIVNETKEMKSSRECCEGCVAKDVCMYKSSIQEKLSTLALDEGIKLGVVVCKYYR